MPENPGQKLLVERGFGEEMKDVVACYQYGESPTTCTYYSRQDYDSDAEGEPVRANIVTNLLTAAELACTTYQQTL